MSQKLKVERKGHVLCIGLNRPEKYNAMDVELYLALADAYGELQRDDELRCGLLYGEGQHFCAGLELDKWGPQFANGSFPELRPAPAIPSAWTRRAGWPSRWWSPPAASASPPRWS